MMACPLREEMVDRSQRIPQLAGEGGPEHRG